MADVLRVASRPTSKTQLLYAANLSYSQTNKYIEMLIACGMLSRIAEGKSSQKYVITDDGQTFLAQISPRFGRIAQGERSVWT